IIGKGKEQIVLELLAEELGVKENIKFIGGVYGNETLGRYLKASSVYVLAGMGGLSINQAMAFGKPIICSTADGTEKRLVKDKFNGFYFKDDDVNDLAEKIKTIISNNELKKLMGENSLSIIKEDVNVHKVIKEYVAAFNFVSGNNIAYKH
ncbi:MAG: glycosyltransferase family 1 protein, partial [Bacteroidetes bacterium]